MSTSIELYESMYLIRSSEQAIIDYYDENEMKTPMHMSKGEEAIVSGICHVLTDKDVVLGSYRSHALYIAKTLETDGFFGELYAKEHGVAKGKAGSMHLSKPDKGLLFCSAIVGSTISLGVGAALANKMRNLPITTAVFFGDGATDTGTFWESVNYACLEQLPIIFVCEDNGLSVHATWAERRGFNSIADVISKFNCDVFVTDTTDVEKIYGIAKSVVSNQNKISRPAFINLKYYRYLEHVGVHEDFNKGYRGKDEYLSWLDRDPLKHQRSRLLQNEGLTEKEIIKIEEKIDNKVAASVQKAKKANVSHKNELLKGLYK